MILTNPLKKHNQLLSFTLVITFFVIIPFYGCNSSDDGKSLGHITSSFEFSNKATSIVNQHNGVGMMDKDDLDKFIYYKKQALEEAKLVDIHILNQKLDGFGDHFKAEYLKGLETLIDGHENNNTGKFLEGQVLLDQWGLWFSKNGNRL